MFKSHKNTPYKHDKFYKKKKKGEKINENIMLFAL